MLWDHDGFAARYARARQCQAEAWSDEIIKISQERDTDPNDRRVIIDAKKWLMSKLAPKRYGDKLTVAGDDSNPLLIRIEDTIDTLSKPELDALERFALARLAAVEADEDK